MCWPFGENDKGKQYIDIMNYGKTGLESIQQCYCFILICVCPELCLKWLNQSQIQPIASVYTSSYPPNVICYLAIIVFTIEMI